VQGYLLELLFPTGWRRSGQVLWLYEDAVREADRVLKKNEARGIRILSLRVHPDAVLERHAERRGEVASA